VKPPPLAKVFDAAVFATSVLLLCGVIDDRVAKAFGDTTSFLDHRGLCRCAVFNWGNQG
jgi:hypothetical protein